MENGGLETWMREELVGFIGIRRVLFGFLGFGIDFFVRNFKYIFLRFLA